MVGRLVARQHLAVDARGSLSSRRRSALYRFHAGFHLIEKGSEGISLICSARSRWSVSFSPERHHGDRLVID